MVLIAMIKKLVYIGIAVMIIAAVVIFGSGLLFKNSLGKNLSTTNATVQPDSFADIPISNYNSNTLLLYVLTSNYTNIYVLNTSTFSAWSGYVMSHGNASGYAYVEGLHVNSSYVLQDKNSAVVPIPPANGTRNLYVVIDNTPGSKSSGSSITAFISYVPLESSSVIIYGLAEVVAFIVLGAGLIVMIYGALKKGAPRPEDIMAASNNPKEQKQNEYVNQLYKDVGKKKKNKKKKD